MVRSAHRLRRKRTFTAPIRRLLASRAQLRRSLPFTPEIAATGEGAGTETTKARISTTTMAMAIPTVPATPRRGAGVVREQGGRPTGAAPAPRRAADTALAPAPART